MRIGELAALAGVSTRTVRHYHGIGLLPEPARRANGYRRYGLRDLVLVLRVRRLVGIGLSLDEVAAALARDASDDLRDLLADLDRDLAAQQDLIARRRAALAALLTGGTGLWESPELTAVVAELGGDLGADHPGVRREQLVLEAIGGLTGSDDAGAHAARLLAELGDRVPDALRRFEQLAGADPDDSAVEEVAAAAGGFAGLLTGRGPGPDPTPQDRDRAAGLLRAVAADLAPAQARCLELMVGLWGAR